MIYHLAEYLDQTFDFPGAGIFHFLSFRASSTIVASLLIGIIFGKAIIGLLQRRQIGEQVRNLGLEGQLQKRGTPTMGGIIILAAILAPVLLFADLTNIYIQIMLFTTVWLGVLGFADDYIKVFRKRKEGLSGRLKIVAQVLLGVTVGTVMWMSEGIVTREAGNIRERDMERIEASDLVNQTKVIYLTQPEKSTTTTIPFFKNSHFDYRDLIPIEGKTGDTLGWLLYVLVATLVITAVSNGTNLTDGLDGLAGGLSAIVGVVLGVFAYLSGNVIYSDYLYIMNIPGSGELMVFAGAFVGALIGFLWYNSYPAQVFMGDTGSLAIGGIIATMALLVRKELLLPVLCGVFLVESFSVIVQVVWFKYTRWRYGQGRRVFLMAPLHHHYQKRGYFEVKIVNRFWIVQLLLAAITIMTLKIR